MRKTCLTIRVTALLASPLFCLGLAGQDWAGQIDIPFQKFVLDNGLTLIVHEDHKAPIVAVNVWYHVGSKNEKRGRTGFAHLFEHLMFNGTENYDDEFFEPLEKVGATGMNGTTNADRTNYFENVPSNALDLALWLESDRMGHLLGALSEEKVNEQRGVVQNEKRQGENQPYGKVRQLLTENTYPAGHPYSWTTIGSMEDLDAASLEDVKEWFRSYYGTANAVLVVAGDVDTQAVKAKVEKYFGDIPSGPPVSRQSQWLAKMSGSHRERTEDRVPQDRIYKTWNVPPWGSREGTLLGLVARVLSSGKVSRLYKRLVYEDQIATNVSAFNSLREIGGQFRIQATAQPGKSLAEVEKALDEELQRLLRDGPTQEELDRVRTQYFSQFVRGLERIGGFGGKSDTLAQNEVYGGRPDYYKTTLHYVEEATPADLKQVAQKWLSDGVFILEVHPFPKYRNAAGIDRSTGLPAVGEPPEPRFPRLQRSTLANGLKVIVAERHTLPLVNFNLLIDAGYAADQLSAPGTASMTASMMDEGTRTRSALQISEEIAKLGAQLGTGTSLDTSSVFLSALKANLDPSLELFAEIALHPSFPEQELQRLKRQRLAQIRREKVSPVQMALRVLPRLLYGKGHAYGNPLTGSGTEESTRKVSRQDLVSFHQAWYRPNNATLVVVGDTTPDEIRPRLEALFAGWEAGQTPHKNIAPVSLPERPAVYLMDRPDSKQSVILAGHLAPPTNNPEEVAINTMNRILGGSFTSRLNMNLREEKHWSYGAGSILFGARGQRPYFVYAPVQTDKTKESLIEVEKELRQYLSEKPPTDEELDKAKKGRILSLPGNWETLGAVGSSINQIVRYGLPDDYFDTLPGKARGLTLASVESAAQNVIHP
ncbi:MAG: M16 family metallopeptidase, partial [Acidobacteriota bacterium]